jgi:ATP-dependent Clp protease adaptor protein ClpS
MGDTVGAAAGSVDANTYSGTVPAQTLPETDVRVEEEAGVADAWVTIVWNDPVNLMTYVSYVFQSYFGYPAAKAERLMRQVHEEGRAVVSTGNREHMEVDVQAMHGFGLWATLQQGGV